ncbi:DUF2929 family protein [Salirhabdus salicampi]|uniref:DUF2929 family protein n=1 Tax=Salirhabdus salicampi TaxID=476102 RepID=UPI0020C1BD49|nr:DUF2929 family protein [Salirhabdus salicampi]MCP8615564.1 YjzD family protein [Salirhabdus salicampi]
MRYLVTLLWSFLLSGMVVYVVSSMSGIEFSGTGVVLLAIAFTVCSIVLGDGVLKEETDVS